ncbi:MAG TPA: GAF domain-containing protein [Candidatus Kapabacteria bacterium]|nr:GAF domain-containing protein [Candidatus Kapabacteria bacterium]
MALNSSQFREAVKPQDTVAVVITLMGVAIAIFLADAIIKLIGASIAALGLVALYVTIRQRISDQVHLRSRRTTLPPPAFKTRVTQDPSTSTKRIFFDDFQATFAPADDDLEESGEAGNARTAAQPSAPVQKAPAAPAPSSSGVRTFGDDTFDDLPMPDLTDDPLPAPRRAAGLAGASRDSLDGAALPDTGAESFRVVKPARSASPAETSNRAEQEAPAASAQPGGDTVSERPAPVPAAPDADRRPAKQAAPEPVAQASGEAQPRPANAQPAGSQPARVMPPVPTLLHDDPRGDAMPTRRQAPFIVEDLASDGDEDVRGGEPRGEFVRLVGQVLNAIARSIQARSIVFFWVNFEKGHLIPEAKVTTGRYEIRAGARIPLGNDVVSQIARSGVPEVITDISTSAERELIAYYNGFADTRSFVGVPVFFRREVVGVLAADSNDENAFDEVSVATLAEYTRLIAGLIRSYTEKYDLHLIARTLDAFDHMSRDFSGTAPGPVHTAETLASQVAGLFDTRYAAVVLFDESAREWIVAACDAESGPVRETVMGLAPDMRTSLVGRATRYAQEVLVENVGNEIRFTPGENLESGGSFLAIPLVATTKCFGTLAVEHPAPEAYIPRDIELLRSLARYAAMAIEVFNTNRAIEAQVVLDEVTGLYNAEFLIAALDREIARARDYREKLSFALISIDMPASLRAENSPELEEIIAGSVGSVVEKAIRPYDTVGRYDSQLFGVVLVKRGDQDAYLWAEKLRKEVASSILALGDRKSAVTISVGISDLGDHATRDSMITGARQALEKARGGDGNAVILY